MKEPCFGRPGTKDRSMSAELDNVHTLPELREWLKKRARWYLDWQMAPQEPKPIPSAFRNAIIAMFRSQSRSFPSDPAKVEQWANQYVLRFSLLTIYDVHGWLQTNNIFDAPECPSLDADKDERIFVTTLEHLSRLLNFVGIRAGERSTPDGQAEGEKAEGPRRRRRKGRGRPSDTDPQRDKRIYDAWGTRHYKTYDKLAGEFRVSKQEVMRAIDRERKRRKK